MYLWIRKPRHFTKYFHRLYQYFFSITFCNYSCYEYGICSLVWLCKVLTDFIIWLRPGFNSWTVQGLCFRNLITRLRLDITPLTVHTFHKYLKWPSCTIPQRYCQAIMSASVSCPSRFCVWPPIVFSVLHLSVRSSETT